MKKRITRALSWLLSLLMVMSCVPLAALPVSSAVEAEDNGMLSFVDNFDSYTGNVLEAGDRYSFTDAPALTEEAGRGKVLSISGLGSSASYVLDIIGMNDLNRTLSFDFKYTGGELGHSMGMYAYPYYDDSNNQVYALVSDTDIGEAAVNGVTLKNVYNGVDSAFAAHSETYSADTWYSAKLQLTGNVMSAKIWPAGGSEPTAWTVSGMAEFDPADEEAKLALEVYAGENITFYFDNLGVTSAVQADEPDVEVQDISFDDSRIKYVGRWLMEDDHAAGYWCDTYLEARFTGSVFKAVMKSATSVSVQVDGGEVFKRSASGTMDLSAYLDADAEIHTVRIGIAEDGVSSMQVQKLIIAGEMQDPSEKPLIEFVGDSITAGAGLSVSAESYAAQAARALGADKATIAIGGIALVDGWNGNSGVCTPDTPGMNARYFWQKPYNSHTDNGSWTFAYTPDLVVINLGTNDVDMTLAEPPVDTDVFVEEYVDFVQRIRSEFAEPIPVVLVIPFQGFLAEEIAAVQTELGDSLTYVVDATDWLGESGGGNSNFGDHVHPSQTGHDLAGEEMAAALRPILFASAIEIAESALDADPTGTGADDLQAAIAAAEAAEKDASSDVSAEVVALKKAVEEFEAANAEAGVAATGVTLDKSEAELVLSKPALRTVQLTAAVEPAEATNQKIRWSSSNVRVASVENGLVTAVGTGAAVITATTWDGSYTASCAVTVVATAEEQLGQEFTDSFDSYTGDTLSAGERYSFSHSYAPALTKEGDNQILEISGLGAADSYVMHISGLNSLRRTLSFDFKYSGDLGPGMGLYAYPYFAGNDDQLYALISDADGSGGTRGIRLKSATQNSDGFASANAEYAQDTWYTIKMLMDGSDLSVKIWPRGEEEPAAWTVSGTTTYVPVDLETNMALEVYANEGVTFWFDNLAVNLPVDGEQPDAPEDPALGDLIFEDDYNDYDADSLPEGDHYQFDSAPALAEEDGRGGVLEIPVSSAGSYNTYNFDIFAGVLNKELKFDFKFTGNVGTWGGLYASPYYDRASNEMIYALLTNGTGDNVHQGVTLKANVGAEDMTDGFAWEAYDLDEGIWYTTKLRLVGAELAAKVWPADEEEPAEWLVSGTSALVNPVNSNGVCNLEFVVVGTNEAVFCVDNLSIAEVEDNRVQYEITVVSEDAEKGAAEGSGSYVEGSTATVIAKPADGYVFAGWKNADGQIISEAASYSFTVTQEVKLTACFAVPETVIRSFMADGLTKVADIDEENKRIHLQFASDVDLANVYPYFYLDAGVEVEEQCYERMDLSSGSATIGEGDQQWTIYASKNSVMTTFYVDGKRGSDSNNGLSAGTAFRTLERAKEALGGITAWTGDVVISIAKGEYVLDETLKLGLTESADQGYAIIWQGTENPNEVVISGGHRLNGAWTESADVTGLDAGLVAWEYDATGLPYARDLYVDGAFADLASIALADVSGSWNTADVSYMQKTASGYTVTAGAPYDLANMHTWRNHSDIEFGYLSGWTFSIVPVKTIEASGSGSAVKMLDDAYYAVSNKAGMSIVDPTLILNCFEGLDTAGEWYFDRAAQKIYYITAAGENPNNMNVVLPELEQLVTVKGQAADLSAGTGAQWVYGMTFKNLTFRYTSYLKSHYEGQADLQASWCVIPESRYWDYFHKDDQFRKTDGAVIAAYTEGMRVTGCIFRNLAASAVDFEAGCLGSTFVGNTIQDIGATGVSVGMVSVRDAQPNNDWTYVEGVLTNQGKDPDRVTRYTLVFSNHIERFAQVYLGSIGVFGGFTADTTIAHNDIFDAPYSGISAGWGWGCWDEGGSPNYNGEGYHKFDTPSAQARYVIENNEIWNISLHAADGGAIYTLGMMPGSKIVGNVMHDNPVIFGGIYNDEASGGFTEYAENITWNCHTDWNYHNAGQQYGDRLADVQNTMRDNYFDVPQSSDALYQQILDRMGPVLLPPEVQDVAETELGVSLSVYRADSVTADGSLTENWLMTADFDASAGGPAGKLGAQWDDENLYLAMETGTATKVRVTLGTVTTVYDIASGTFSPAVNGASAAVSGTKLEMVLPLAACGIAAKTEDQNVTFAAALQTADESSVLKVSGLTLRYSDVLFGSDMDNFAAESFVTSDLAFGNTTGISFTQTADGAMNAQYGGGSLGIEGLKHAIAYDGGAFDLEYTVKLTDLPIAGDATLAHWRGLVFELEYGNRYRYSLTRDAENNVLFNAMDHLENGELGTAATVDTGLQVGDTATIRASVDDDNTLSLYVNGVLVAAVGELSNGSNASNGYFDIYVNFAGDETGSLNADIYDFVLSKPKMAPVVSGSELSTYIAADAVTVDGNLTENWLMTADFDASAGGPAGKLGAQWDDENLYLAMETGTATKVRVTLGTVTTVYDIASGTFSPAVTGASAAVSGTKLEMVLPLAACGITAKTEDQNVTFAAALQTANKSSALKAAGLNLRYSEVLFGTDMDNFAADGFTTSDLALGNVAGVGFTQTADGALNVTYGGGSLGITGLKHALDFDGGAFDLEYTVKLTDLPIAGDATLAHWRGLVFELEYGNRYRYSLTRDAENNVLFNAMSYTNRDESGIAATVDTGLQVGDTATIRASVDADNVLTLYVNGTLLATLGELSNGSNTSNGYFDIYVNFAGTETGSLDVDIYDFVLSKPKIAAGTSEIGQMLSTSTEDDVSNTWMFDGGAVTVGSYGDISGARSYVYHFEEWVRWGNRQANSTYGTQRYVFNVGKDGQDLSDSLNAFDTRAAALNPRAAVYLIGEEDYSVGAAGLDQFKENLKNYVEKAVALRAGKGFAVIQTPYPVDAHADNQALYAQAARDVVEGLNAETAVRVLLIDHYSDNGWDPAKHLNEDGSLSILGHLEMARQMCALIWGAPLVDFPTETMADNFPNLVVKDSPEVYSDTAPTVISGADSLQITLPAGMGTGPWVCVVETDDYVLTTEKTGTSFTISGLPTGAAYTLTITAADWSVQLPIMSGTVTEDAAASAKDTAAGTGTLATLMENKEALTWLFMGDSITHGAWHVGGYDSVSVSFEKYLRDDLGRVDDLVINTAVSGATAPDTVSNLAVRLSAYDPDVVSIMLGTNDGLSNVSEAEYKSALRTLINAAQDKGAVVILRTPIPTKYDDNAGVTARVKYMREVAEEYNNVLVVDQYALWSEMIANEPYYSDVLYNDNLHPNAVGQLLMFRQFVESLNLPTGNRQLTSLEYEYKTRETSKIEATIVFADGAYTLNASELSKKYGQSLTEVTMIATAENGDTYAVTGFADDLALKNLPDGEYSFSVIGSLKNAAKTVSFVGVVTTDPVEPEEPASVMGISACLGSTVNVDGALTENWLMLRSFDSSEGGPAGKLGAQWDGTNLYLAMETGTATKVRVTLGTVTTVYDIASDTFSPAVTGASAAVSGTKLEMALPLAACGITAKTEDQNVTFAAELQTADKSSALKVSGLNLRYYDVMFGSDMDNFAAESFVTSDLAFGNTAGISFTQTADGAMNVQYGGGSLGIKGLKHAIAYNGGAFDLEYTVKLTDLPIAGDPNTAHWRGLVFEMEYGNRYRYSLTRDASDNVLFNAMTYTNRDENGIAATVDTGLQVGDTATIRASVDADNVLSLYVNGTLLAALGELSNGSNASNGYFEIYVNFAGNETGSLNADIYDLILSKPNENSSDSIAQNLLDSLTFDDIKGTNTAQNSITDDLAPVYSLSWAGTDYDVTWTTSDADVLAADGSITGGSAEGTPVRFTASVKVGDTVKTKTFDLTVYLTMDADMLYLEKDRNPYTGAMMTTKVPQQFTLDMTYNSVGYDLGSVQTINRVILVDNDGAHKMHKIDLSLYVSDDNVTYTKVKDFTMANTGETIYFYNFSAQGRYVKVHCHYDTNEAAEFTNSLSAMIWCGNETELPGNGGGSFSQLGAVTATACAAGEDVAVYVSKEDLNVFAAELQADYRDLRFVLDGDVLSYWLDDDGVYIRVPQAEKDASVTLNVYGGNANAVSLSDMESVFEVTYGNKTIQNLTTTHFDSNIAVTKAPNGDLLAIGNPDRTEGPNWLYLRRSTDGGRTWAEPVMIFNGNGKTADGTGLLVDNGSIWCFFHYGLPLTPNSDECLRIAVIRSDDNGYSWSDPVIVETDYYYHVMYCDGVKTAAYDGEGPEIDYVAGYHFMETYDDPAFETSVIFSRDGGKTWVTSESKIGYQLPGTGGESGITEASIAVLSDGTLKLLARCQYESVTWLCESYSYDNGETWTQGAASNVTSVNGMPALKNYEDEIYLLWAGNNIMGGASYQRYPLTLAYSDDDMDSWQKKLNLYAGTSMAQYPEPSTYWDNGSLNIAIQPSMARSIYNDSDDLLVGWWGNWQTNRVMLIEDIDNFLHKTKGAADNFEGVSAKYEDWLPGAKYGTVEITDQQAANGNQSLKIVHSTGNQGPVRATRSVPAMMNGEIRFDVYLENANTGFYVELKTAYTTAHWTGDRIAFSVDGSGNVKAFDVNTKAATTLGSVERNKWYEMNLKFNLETGAAELYLDGELLGSVPVNMDSSDAVAFVQISDGTGGGELVCYIDDFIAYEVVPHAASDDSDSDSIAANEVVSLIDAIGDVTLNSERAIVAAREAYDALTDAQKALVDNLATLANAERKLAQLKKAAADQEAADEVEALIEAIGEVALDSKDAIEDAEAAYERLTDDQKTLVTNHAALVAARKTYDELKAAADKLAADKAAAKIVDDLIAAIGEVELTDEEAISNARAAYTALTDDQKSHVKNLQTLIDAEAALKQLKDQAAADAVKAKIEAIGTVTLESLADIVDAETAYAALTDAQKALVTNHEDLIEARETYNELKAAADKLAADKAAAAGVDAKIEEIGEVTLDSKDAIEAARNAYTALEDDQEQWVTKLDVLEKAEVRLADLQAANAVDTLIDLIGDVTLEDKAAIEAAEKAYNALTEEQQAEVKHYADLTAARAEYNRQKAAADKLAADKAAAKGVDDLIDSIGEVDLDSKDRIEAVRAAYEALTADEKAHVTKLAVLEAAEAEYARLKEQRDLLISMIIAGASNPKMPFTDVTKADWFYDEVNGAWQAGLINGMTETTFEPNSSLTVAQAIKLAAALHQRNEKGRVTLKNGDTAWYSSYVEYAVRNKIIGAEYLTYSDGKMNSAVSRAEFVHILHGAMSYYKWLNNVADNAIPDVKTGSAYASEIYEFYRAGILTGSDAAGTFYPASSIKRSEVAAILVRMYDKDARQAVTLN